MRRSLRCSGDCGVQLPLPTSTEAPGEQVTVSIRPESFDVAPSGARGSFDLAVGLVETRGSEAFVYGLPRAGGAVPSIGVKVGKQERPRVGDTFSVRPTVSTGPTCSTSRPGVASDS